MAIAKMHPDTLMHIVGHKSIAVRKPLTYNMMPIITNVCKPIADNN